MASDPQTIAWERLAPPPRHVPWDVQARVRIAEIKNTLMLGNGFVGFVSLFFGAFLSIAGTILPSIAEQEKFQILGVFLVAAGISIWIGLAALIFVRGRRNIHLLRNGVMAQGTITKAPHQLSFTSFENFVKGCEPFRPSERTEQLPTYITKIIAGMQSRMKFLTCKVRVAIGDTARYHELKVRLDLSSLMTQHPRDAKVRVLCDPPNLSVGIDTSDFYPGVTISADGHWAIERTARVLVFVSSFLRSSVPVVATYLWAALGLTLFGGEFPTLSNLPASPLACAGIVAIGTITHAVVPVFIFRLMLDHLPRSAEIVGPWRVFLFVFRGMSWFGIAFWFCVPIVVLAYYSGWLTLVWLAVHIALAKRGTRQWVFLEYGSTSMALFAFLLCFSAEQLFPLGLAVIILQSLLLAVLESKARKRWLSSGTEMK